MLFIWDNLNYPMTETTFVADVMVGKLARWLRVLGFDVLYSNTYDDDEVIQIAEGEKRVILTRDRRLARRRTPAKCFLIESGDYKQQLQQVLRSFNLKDFKLFSRCIECNARLEEADKEVVFDKVPPFVYLTQDRFAQCPACDRIYWHGTHTQEMLKQICPDDHN
jgi:uncharacterized protein with PIN domain